MMEFRAIEHTVLGIPGYIFFAGTGFVVSICTFIVLLYRKKYPVEQNLRFLLISIVFLFLFARGFGILSTIYRNIGEGRRISWDVLSEGGIVYFGGLFGLLAAFYSINRIRKTETETIDILAVCIPLFHSFARVGCFFGGCCFGRETTGLISLKYTALVEGQIITAQRIPTQLIEALFNLFLFLYLLLLLIRPNWKEKRLLHQYLLIYSIGRFVIEFFRGDSVRGVAFGVSFSQIICMLIVLIEIVLIIVHYYQKKKRRREVFS